MLSKKRAASIIREYSGNEATDIDIYPDPQIDTAYAIQCKEGGIVMQYLLTSWTPAVSDEEASISCLEEAEFDTWPPQEGTPRFL